MRGALLIHQEVPAKLLNWRTSRQSDDFPANADGKEARVRGWPIAKGMLIIIAAPPLSFSAQRRRLDPLVGHFVSGVQVHKVPMRFMILGAHVLVFSFSGAGVPLFAAPFRLAFDAIVSVHARAGVEFIISMDKSSGAWLLQGYCRRQSEAGREIFLFWMKEGKVSEEHVRHFFVATKEGRISLLTVI